MGNRIIYIISIFLIAHLTFATMPVVNAGGLVSVNEVMQEEIVEDASSQDLEEGSDSGSIALRINAKWIEFKNSLHSYLREVAINNLSPQSAEYVLKILEVVFTIQVLFLSFLFASLFVINLLITSIVIVISSFYKNYVDSVSASLSSKYEDILIKYLFEEMSLDETINSLSKSKTRLRRNILITQIFNYQQNLSGEYKERILILYKELKLYKLSERKTKSIFSYQRVRGIRELVTLYPSGAKEIIAKSIKDKDSIVRNEALISAVYLDKDVSFDFIKGIKGSFSDWVQLNILSYLKLNEKTVPSFKEYLRSDNIDVQNFAIRMVDYFQQSENMDVLLELLDHPNEKTRKYVYQAIHELEDLSALNPVRDRFRGETLKNKIEILKIIQNLGNESDFDLLVEILHDQNNVRLKLNACRTLYNMGEKGRDVLKEYSETVDMGILAYVEHVKDKRL